MKNRFIYVALAMLLILAGCKAKSESAKIEAIGLDPMSPVPVNSDVRVTATTAGTDLTYNWTVTDGILRNASARSAQAAMPRVAVTKAALDDFGQVLIALGIPFKEKTLDIITSSSDLDDYDCLFVNSSDEISTASSELALRTWVSNGGALYTSGRGADLVTYLWPGKITLAEPLNYIGLANPPTQHVPATVVDQGFAASFGKSSLGIHYPDTGWPPILAVDSKTTTLVTGNTSNLVPIGVINNLPPGQDFQNMPVAVSFASGKGKVLYTNFQVVDGMSPDESFLLAQLAGIVLSWQYAKSNHDLVNLGGYSLATDFTGFLGKKGTKSFKFNLSQINDAFFVLQAPIGQFRLQVNGPGSAQSDFTGLPPMTAAYLRVPPGSWNVSVDCTDNGNTRTIPFALTMGTRVAGLQLITTVPEVIWHSPKVAGSYDLTLKIVDGNGKSDEKTISVAVE